MAGKDKRERSLALAKILVTVVVLFFVLNLTSWAEVRKSLDAYNLHYLPVLIVLLILFLFVGALNNYLIVRSIAPLPFFKVLKMFFVAAFVGMFTPAYLGEVGSVAYMLRREGVPLSQGLSVTSIDKLVTVAVNSALCLIGLTLYFPQAPWFAWGAAALLLCAPIFLIWCPTVRGTVRRLVINRYFSWSEKYFSAVCSFFVEHPILLCLNLIGTIARAFLAAYMIWVGFLAFGIVRDPSSVIFVSFVARMVGYIPLTVNGLGLLEGTAMKLFCGIGVPEEVTLLTFLIDRGITCTLCAVGALCVLWRLGSDPSQRSQPL